MAPKTSIPLGSNATLTILNHNDIRAAMHSAKENLQETDKFNTHGHSHSTINDLVPEGLNWTHVEPSPHPSRYRNWVSLLMGQKPAKAAAEWHIFELPRYLVSQVRLEHSAWFLRNEVNETRFADLLELFPSQTTAGISTDVVFDGTKDWFLRLDQCSTKDAKGSEEPVRNVRDVLMRLCSSRRGETALADALRDEPGERSRVFLVPWDKMMDPGREFRVFCPPPRGEIVAVSQYRWTSPFPERDVGVVTAAGEVVVEKARRIHGMILEHARGLDADVLTTMRAEGFTFDVLLTAGRVQLVEVNGFGAMSGCGSCLFQWIDDARQLYGLEEGVEVRVSMSEVD